jgi:hypothetical protein
VRFPNKANNFLSQRSWIGEHREVVTRERDEARIPRAGKNVRHAPTRHDMVVVEDDAQRRLRAPASDGPHIHAHDGADACGKSSCGDARPNLCLRNAEWVVAPPEEPDRKTPKRADHPHDWSDRCKLEMSETRLRQTKKRSSEQDASHTVRLGGGEHDRQRAGERKRQDAKLRLVCNGALDELEEMLISPRSDIGVRDHDGANRFRQ